MLSKQNNYFVAILSIVLIATSCEHANQEFVEQGCLALYKVNSIQIKVSSRSIQIIPELSFDRTFDKESRRFYNSIDTSLVKKGWIKKRGSYRTHMDADWSLIDWRLTRIDVKTLDAFDDSHEAGSLLNDVLEIEYFYKWTSLSIPLGGFLYGNLMLADYHPHNDYIDFTNGGFRLRLQGEDMRELPKCEVTIEDYFGNIYTKKSEK